MALVADLAAAAAGASAVLALTLAYLALRAWRATGSRRNQLLGWAFLLAAVQGAATGLLLLRSADVAVAWLAVPGGHLAMLAIMYVALMRV